jgi:hypothetical protein
LNGLSADTLHVVDHAPHAITPLPTKPGQDTAYYRNVELSARDGRFILVDAAGKAHPLAAEALAWVEAPAKLPRLLVLDQAGAVLAELDSEGWDLDRLRDFGDVAGVPLVEDSYDDALTARAAYPLPRGALRIHARDTRSVLVQFLPVLLPVLVIIIIALLLG